MTIINLSEIKATPFEKEDISKALKAITRGQPFSYAQAWVLWAACATVDKSDPKEVERCLMNGLGDMHQFLIDLGTLLQHPDLIPSRVFRLRIGRGATWAEMVFNDTGPDNTVTWRISEAIPESEAVEIFGRDLAGLALGHVAP